MLDVIIPHYGRVSMLEKLLFNLRHHEPKTRVIVVDNANTVGGNYPQPDVWVSNSHNVGFVRAVNQGLALMENEYVAIVNNDVFLHDDALTRLVGWLERDPRLGAVCPVAGHQPAPGSWVSVDRLWKRFAGTWSQFVKLPDSEIAKQLRTRHNTHHLLKAGMIPFFCTVFRREAIERTGLLSTEFGVGLGDDDDYCDRLQRLSYDVALALDVLVTHGHRTTFKKLYTEDQISEMQQEAMRTLKRRRFEREAHTGKRGAWPMG